VSSGSPTLYHLSRADLVNAGSSGLGFSTACERRAKGLSIIQAADLMRLRMRSASRRNPIQFPLTQSDRIGEMQTRYKDAITTRASKKLRMWIPKPENWERTLRHREEAEAFYRDRKAQGLRCA